MGATVSPPGSPEPFLAVCDGEPELRTYPACDSDGAAWMHPITAFLKDPCQLYACSQPQPTLRWPYIDVPEDPFWLPAEGSQPDNPYVDPTGGVWNDQRLRADGP
uniref:Uncharacterized protein n=1 Tax=Sorangium cellulosum TaxID=56 RepID=A0A3S7V027_SORCE|nr:hypothetical protein [Sorangium cellulosum]